MDTMQAWARGEANRGKPLMVFDWHKAARLIKELKPKFVTAGLSGDWEWTGGTIYDNGPIHDCYTYLASTWATPEISIDGNVFDCFIMESETEWRADTKWPQSAIDILNS